MSTSTISLESLYGNQRTLGGNTSKAAAVAFAKVGLMPTLFESCEDATVYAVEAANMFNEGVAFSRLANYSLEGIANDANTIKRVNAKAARLGLESAIYSTEDFKKAVKTGFRKVILTIKAAIQRFIMAVGNLIKSIANWVGGQLAKLQVKKYQEYLKSKIDPNITGVDVINIPSQIIDKKDQTKAIRLIVELVNRLMPKLNAAQAKAIAEKVEAGAEKAAATAVFVGSLNIDFGVASAYVNKQLKAGKAPSGQAVANILAYGSAKLTNKSVKISAIPPAFLAILSSEALQIANYEIKVARQSSAALAKTMSWTDQLEKVASSTGKLNKKKVAELMFFRNAHQFTTGVLLSSYSLFLKQRSIAYRIVKARLSAKKAAPGIAKEGKAISKAGDKLAKQGAKLTANGAA
jgi:hypothetical protein